MTPFINARWFRAGGRPVAAQARAAAASLWDCRRRVRQQQMAMRRGRLRGLHGAPPSGRTDDQCGRQHDGLPMTRKSSGVTQPSLAATMKPVQRIQDSQVAEYARQAQLFMGAFRWSGGVVEAELAWAAAGLLGVFRMRIAPSRDDIDEVVWVITGDLPPAYIAYDPQDTWQDALRGYVDEMQRWADAATAGQSVAELIPVNVDATAENAARLESRLAFIRTELLGVPAESLESDT